MAAPAASLYDHVRIGSRVFPFSNFAEVSAAYRNTIDRLGLGASRTPPCKIFDATGRQTALVSYNGRVWTYDPTDPFGHCNRTLCLYDPRPDPAAAGALPPERYAPGATMQVPV